MLIGFDASRANQKEKTGVEWYAFYLIQVLKKIDKINNYLLYTPTKLNSDFLTLPSNFQEKILNWPFTKNWTIGRLSWEMLVHPPDLLIVPAHTFPLIGARKNLITWHDLAYEYYPEYYQQKELISLKTGAKRMIKMANKIIAVSQFTKDELIKHYQIPPSKIEVVYLGYDSEKYDLKKIKLKSLAKYQITKPYLIFIGRIEAKKNLINLIKAFELLKNKFHQDYQLVLIGKFSYQHEKILKAIYQTKSARDIFILNWLDEEEKINFLAQAKIFIYPSYYEGFGLPIIEAMALNIPVIASRVAAIPEIGGPAVAYFQPDDYEEIANLTNKIISNDFFRNSLITTGEKQVKNFSWQRCGIETLKIINKL